MSEPRLTVTVSATEPFGVLQKTESIVETATILSAKSESHHERNVTIDVLRGLCIVSMLAGHFGTETYTKYWTHLPRFFDGASGFVFLSGLVLGMIHGRRTQRHGDRNTTFLIWKRAGLLWCAHVIFTTIAFVIHESTGRIVSLPTVAMLGGWFNTIWLIATLRMQPFGLGLDILPLYSIFLLYAPLVLFAMKHNASWLPLTISFLCYLSVQWHPDTLNLVDPRSGGIAFYWAAWQVLFVIGLWVGWHRERLGLIFFGKRRLLLLGGTSLIFVIGLVFAQQDARNSFKDAQVLLDRIYPAFDKPTLGGLHIIYFLTALYPAYFLINTMLQTKLGGKSMRWFALLGRLSLYCFLVHLGYILLIRSFATETWTQIQQEWVTLSGIVFVTLMAKFRILGRLIPN